MTEATRNKIEYMIAIVQMFADKFNMSNRLAYKYLLDFKGVQVLDQHYDILHTLSYDDIVEDLTEYCRKNGGFL